MPHDASKKHGNAKDARPEMYLSITPLNASGTRLKRASSDLP